MAEQSERWRSPGIARDWRALAERRREHFADLYRSGRWRRYYSEQEFLLSVRQVAAEIESWDALAGATLQGLRQAT